MSGRSVRAGFNSGFMPVAQRELAQLTHEGFGTCVRVFRKAAKNALLVGEHVKGLLGSL